MTAEGSLLVVTGPPGAGKSSVARVLADEADRSVLVAGDAFFGFLARGAIEPWRPESSEQNTIVTTAAAAAAGAFARGGYRTIYDGVIGPWFLDTFAAGSGLRELDYLILMPSEAMCVQRVMTREAHGFADEAATRKMHAEFAKAPIAERHVLRLPPEGVADVAALIQAARARGDLTHVVG